MLEIAAKQTHVYNRLFTRSEYVLRMFTLPFGTLSIINNNSLLCIQLYEL